MQLCDLNFFAANGIALNGTHCARQVVVTDEQVEFLFHVGGLLFLLIELTRQCLDLAGDGCCCVFDERCSKFGLGRAEETGRLC